MPEEMAPGEWQPPQAPEKARTPKPEVRTVQGKPQTKLREMSKKVGRIKNDTLKQ